MTQAQMAVSQYIEAEGKETQIKNARKLQEHSRIQGHGSVASQHAMSICTVAHHRDRQRSLRQQGRDVTAWPDMTRRIDAS